MKRVKIIGLSILLLASSITAVDLFVLRGYYYTLWFPMSYGKACKATSSQKAKLIVTRIDDHKVKLENPSLSFRRFTTYRNDAIYFPFDDQQMTTHACWLRSSFDHDIAITSEFAYGCGTGLGESLIKPFEAFSYTFDSIEHRLRVHLWNNARKFQYVFENYTYDSVYIQFMIPLDGWISDSCSHLWSNEISFSYQAYKQIFQTQIGDGGRIF